MTDKERREEVREAIAKLELKPSSRDLTSFFDNHCHLMENSINQILSLKDKDGKPMLGIISDDQSLPDRVGCCMDCLEAKDTVIPRVNIFRGSTPKPVEQVEALLREQAEISFKAGKKAMKEEMIKFLKKHIIPCYGGNRLILRTDWKELLK